MSGLANSALRLLRRLLGEPATAGDTDSGDIKVLDGNTAVALLEGEVSEVAGLGASYPADGAVLAWRLQQHHSGKPEQNPLSGLAAESPRGALAAAMGLAMSGSRATAFFSGPDLASAQDLLSAAAGLHLPLVLHAGNRGLASSAATLGSGHEAMRLAAESGSFVLVPANVQEAVDFAAIARHVAEQALLPGLVMQDGEQTALALQDVQMPSGAFLKQFLGTTGEQISSPTPAQQLLFGEYRRRVPRRLDMDRPVMLGALQPAETWGLAQAAGAAFFNSYLSTCLEQGFSEFAKHSGRLHQSLTAYRVKGAKLVLIAQGAAIETAEAVAEHLQDLRVGVIGIRCLRPFPAEKLADLLGNVAGVCVMERVDTPLAADPPLMTEVRAALACAQENSPPRSRWKPQHRQPRLLSVVYGMGGLALSSADLIALCRQAATIKRSKIYLGINFSGTFSSYPKRQVLLDQLRRNYPEITDLGLRAKTAAPRLQPEKTFAAALYRRSGGQGEGLASELAVLLQRLLQGGLRCRPGTTTESWGGCVVDRITAATESVLDPGDEIPVDLALVIAGTGFNGSCPIPEIITGGNLLIVSAAADLWPELPGALQNHVRKGGVSLYQVHPDPTTRQAGNACLAGSICAVLLETGQLDVSRRRLLRVQEDLLTPGEGEGQELLEHFQSGLQAVRKIDISQLPGDDTLNPVTGLQEDEVPAVVRRLGTIDDSFDSLPRFWNQVGVLFRNGDVGELTADPYLALGAIPPLTVGFRDLGPLQEHLPVFDAGSCTACGNCWSNCPDGAIGALIQPPQRLLEAVMHEVGATVVQPLLGKLATGIAAICRDSESQPLAAGELVSSVFATMADKLPFAEERKLAIETGIQQIAERLGQLPLAVTQAFFEEPEMEQRGNGELLALAIDPAVCKGCGICVQSCPEAALDAVPRTPEEVATARRLRSAWELLPASGPETIARMSGHPDVSAMAALLLSGRSGPGAGGGDSGEPGSAARLALRITLAAIEAHQAVVFARYLAQVQTYRQKITALIRDLLADALPTDDLDALARGLEQSDSRQADISVFIGEAENAISSAVDAAHLNRLVALARGLTDLAWRLEKGRQGFGRSRVSMVLSGADAAEWAGGFPHNPFNGPVMADNTGDGAQLAAGLLEGQLRQTTADAVLLRRAQQEIEQPGEAVHHWSELESLQWRDLSGEEQSRCPVLLLAGESSTLGERGLAQLAHVLGGELPLKILIFADLDLGLGSLPEVGATTNSLADSSANLALLTLSVRSASVAQTSVGAPRHFLDSLQQAIAYRGPALLHVHAPNPVRHGYATGKTLERARAAVDTRVFPLFRYDPETDGVFGSRITLDGNPSPRDEWNETPDDQPSTPADWALGERRFAACFTPVTEDDANPLPLDQYLRHARSERKNSTPVVTAGGEGGRKLRLRVAEQLVQASEERLHGWRVLQELAGLVTPFTAQVQRDAREHVAATHQAELEAQAKAYELRIAGLQEEILQQTRQDMRLRLLRLAGYRSATAAKVEVAGNDSKESG